MNDPRLTMAQALLRFLAAQFVERDGEALPFFAGVLGIFGHGNVAGLGQALAEAPCGLRYYQPRNEQAMVHTAAAYAKMKNRLQTFACTSSVGPGATNMVTGAAGATINRLPVLLLPGDVFASRLPHPVLQQLEFPGAMDVSVNDCFRPVSKYFDRIQRPEQLMASLPEAMRVLTSPAETGAVTLALPQDVQTEAYHYPARFFERRVHRVGRPLPPAADIAEAAALIREARRPLIVSGGGTIYSDASSALDRFARHGGIPVCETQAGKGALPWDHPWQVGPIGSTGGLAANRLAAEADLVLAIGTRLADFTTASKSAFQHPDVRSIAINVAPADAAKLGAFPLVGDARATLEALRTALRGHQTTPDYGARVAALRDEWNAEVSRQRAGCEDRVTQAGTLATVNEHCRPGDVVVCAAGGLPGDLHKLWRAYDPKGYHVEYGYSCMGYEIAGGLGVKMAAPERNVYVLVGDGSYLMLHTEIVTSLQEGHKLVVVLFDNSGFQCIRSLQMSTGSPAFGNELRYRGATTGLLDGPPVPIDFVKNAESLGATAYYAGSLAALREALARADTQDATVVIHVPVSAEDRVPGYDSWWDVPVAEVSTDANVERARREYEVARRRQRQFF